MSRQKTKRAAVRKVVDAQHGVIARAQLVDCGIQVTAIDHQLRARTLRSVHRGVYALGHRELRREGWLMAAILACGPGAVLSHHTAAAVWGLAPARSVIEITLPPGVARRRRAGVHARRTASLPAADVTVRGSLSLTTVARTLLDLAVAVDDHRLEQLIHHADQRGRYDGRDIARVLEHHRGRPGVKALQRVVERIDGIGAAPTRGDLEVAFMRMCDAHGLPRPVVNSRVVGEEVDFRWPGSDLIIETDGGHHRMPAQRERDHAKRLGLEAAGWRVVTLTYAQVIRDPAKTARALHRLLGPAVS